VTVASLTGIVSDSSNNQLLLVLSYLRSPTSVSLLSYGNDVPGEIMSKDDVAVELRSNSCCGQNYGGRPMCGGTCGKDGR